MSVYRIQLAYTQFIFPEKCFTDETGASQNALCDFPFEYKGQFIESCIQDDDENGRFWCSTKAHPITREHYGGYGNWGYCRDTCPFLQEGSSDIRFGSPGNFLWRWA